jgi:hypothetical protein
MLGRSDAKNAVELGETWFDHLDLWRDTPSLQEDFPRIGEYMLHVQKRDFAALEKARKERSDDILTNSQQKPADLTFV